MLRTFLRLLPPADARRLRGLIAALVAAATLHGIAIATVGVLLATLLAGRDARPAAAAAAIAAVAFLVVQWSAQRAAFGIGADSARALHIALGEHLPSVPLGWLDARRRGTLVELAAGGVPQVMSLPAILLRPVVTALVAPLAAALVVAWIDWRWSIGIVAAVVIAALAASLAGRWTRGFESRRHAAAVETTERLLEAARLQPLLRSTATTDRDDDVLHAIEQQHRVTMSSARAILPGLMLFAAVLAGVQSLAIVAATSATASVADAIGLAVVVVHLAAVATTGAELLVAMRMHAGTLGRLDEVLSTPPLPTIAAEPVPGADQNAIAELVDARVDLHGRRILDDVRLRLPRTGLTALVGASGAGKSTLLATLARFHDVNDGAALLDGVDVRTLSPAQLREHLAVVLQEDQLVAGTIAENVRLGRSDASDAEVGDALAAAGLTATIAALPDGIETLLGPEGDGLSGGQRQRLGIARAVLRRAALTIWDEPTSALDVEHAGVVAAAARRLADEASVLIITHDPSLLAAADQVVVLERGAVAAAGPLEHLLDPGDAPLLRVMPSLRRPTGAED